VPAAGAGRTGGRLVTLLLGLDVGTTSTKAAVIDLDGNELAHGRAPMPWTNVPTGAEIAPEALLSCAVDAAREALETAGPVAAVGVSSMAETGILLDREGQPTGTPAIAWHDSRGTEEARRIGEDLDRFAATTGLPPSELCSLAKLRWLRDHDADARRGVRWLNVAEFIVHGLGGEQTAELSLASRTGWLELGSKAVWREALEWAGAPEDFLPQPAVAGTPAGEVTAPELPAARGAVLAVGGHDHLSAAVGAGAVGEGDVLDSSGTAEAFIRAIAPLPSDKVARTVREGMSVGWHAVPDRMCLLGAQWSGQMLSEVVDRLGGDRPALEHDPPAEYRDALDRAGRGGAEILERMAAIAGPHRRLVVAGGWAEGEAAQAAKARWLGSFEMTSATYAGARGAALTAGRAAGLPVAHPDATEVS
jgi:sugar (pentulose or hexulose) kinase